MKILISDKSSPKCAEILRAAGHDVDEKSGMSPEEIKGVIGEYDGLIVRSATKVTADLLSAARKLKLIGRAGTGVDNIDLKAAAEHDVKVMNTPGGNSNAVAELALAKMLMISRDLYTANDSIKNHRWEKKQFKGGEIIGKTLGLLGYGRVSRLLGEKCLYLGMKVICHDPKITKNLFDEDGIELVANPETIYRESDVISVHLTKRPDTLGFLSSAQFEAMRDGVCVINCARGGIVDEKALLAALESGKVAGAGLDVYESEPPTDFALIDHPRTVCTPHIAASTREAQENVAVMVAEQFVDAFDKKEFRNLVS